MSMTSTYVVGAALSCVFGWAVVKQTRRSVRQANKVGEKVVIFGASTGIGKELALQYAERGARLLLVARREPLLQKLTLDCLGSPSGLCEHARFVTADITIEDDLRRVAVAAAEDLGGCDTVIINAGVISVLAFEDLCKDNEEGIQGTGKSSHAADVVEKVFNTNVYAPIMIAKHFQNFLIASKGKFVVVSSVAGTFAAPTRSIYAASKHALNGFFNSLRIELAPKNVAICICLPGSVATDLRCSAVDAKHHASHHSTSAKVEEGSKLTPQECARGIIKAADSRARETYLPYKYKIAGLLQYFFPEWVDQQAAKKYGF
ncbi:uncharacterized protein EV422DRAFT_601918 [Fimicolochytrium jonesii]|uniref:uncharacterized protein n=1 Tax=Fimicolochytrium jonesii TaxID=1396493 RepID=UPI0022FF169C|nr:uncharacterized protein EV422DRAFT_601918 [Fimicolochytrium jonesii]KAI8818542.1 hypothetical protein EV422DRAFT_601918 [Fimicolochytrium jonesii]